MKKYPMTIREILKEVTENQKYGMDDILFFLQEVICLLEDYDGLGECLAFICKQLKENASGQYKEYLPLTEIFSKLCLREQDKLLIEEQKELFEEQKNFRTIQEQYLAVEDDKAKRLEKPHITGMSLSYIQPHPYCRLIYQRNLHR